MRRRSAALLSLTALAFAGAAEARGWMWISQTAGRDPVAAIGDDHGSSLSITCRTGRTPTYVLVIDGPMARLRPGRGVLILVEGQTPVAMRLDAVGLPYRGVVELTGAGDSLAVLKAIQSIQQARKPIVISSGPFRFSVSSLGVRWALAPVVRRCGEPAALIRRAARP